MVRKSRTALFALALLSITTSGSATIIGPGRQITSGQTVPSDNGSYRLVMQTDGNLVLYRQDNTVVWNTRTFTPGSFSTMQTDGNFVEYTPSMQAVFNTRTGGNPGASFSVQNDGNLVVYNSASVPLWNIGADIVPGRDPSKIGDVVGRDMTLPIFGVLGHLGIWDGGRVAQAMPNRTNAVEYVSLNDFKAQVEPTQFWGTAYPNIPNYTITQCFEKHCTNFLLKPWGQTENVSTRVAIQKWIYQAYLIGADYTPSPGWTDAYAGDYYHQPARGLYRCDTFTIAMLISTTMRWNVGYTVPDQVWWGRMNELFATPRTPRVLFNKINSFR